MVIYTDGASRGNPGEAGAGMYVLDTGKRHHKYLGVETNNVAEYEALLMAIRYALRRKVQVLWLRSDSKLMVQQVNGNWKANDLFLQVRRNLAIFLLSKFSVWNLVHVPRKLNSEADRAANEAIDNHGKNKARNSR